MALSIVEGNLNWPSFLLRITLYRLTRRKWSQQSNTVILHWQYRKQSSGKAKLRQLESVYTAQENNRKHFKKIYREYLRLSDGTLRVDHWVEHILCRFINRVKTNQTKYTQVAINWMIPRAPTQLGWEMCILIIWSETFTQNKMNPI